MGASLPLPWMQFSLFEVAFKVHLSVLTGKSANKAGLLEGEIDDQNLSLNSISFSQGA